MNLVHLVYHTISTYQGYELVSPLDPGYHLQAYHTSTPPSISQQQYYEYCSSEALLLCEVYSSPVYSSGALGTIGAYVRCGTESHDMIFSHVGGQVGLALISMSTPNLAEFSMFPHSNLYSCTEKPHLLPRPFRPRFAKFPCLLGPAARPAWMIGAPANEL